MSKTVSGTTSQFAWDVSGILPLMLMEGSTSYVYDAAGFPIEQINGSTAIWLHHDQLGSTRLATDANGNVAASYSFDPYGSLVSATRAITNPFKFAGEYQDPESGLYYLRARYYDPSTGQFVSRDPLLPETHDPYGYGSDSPLNVTDPSGLCKGFDPICWAGTAGNWAIGQVLNGISDPVYAPASDSDLACLQIAADNEHAGWFQQAVGAGLYYGPDAQIGAILPKRNLLSQDGVRFQHYYPNDHGPAHAHVQGPGGDNPTRIGPKGLPLAGDPPMSARQQAVYDANANMLRRMINQIGRWLEEAEGAAE
jgi:RHS repeat-associated protein